ncbi:hypothetical protein RWA19_02495 [Lacticaseibacillus rhamnosus]|nr:hypothetical protein [Lacticaseibacillus rhamnosus]WNX03860.1 hypothetical protein RWA19_02495 [Lacticaseibacillus rhamnosus]
MSTSTPLYQKRKVTNQDSVESWFVTHVSLFDYGKYKIDSMSRQRRYFENVSFS